MDDLSRLADMAEIIGAAVVIGGIFFAIVQMRQLRQQRRELAAIELFRFFGSPQFSKAYREVLRLPDGLDMAGLRAHSPDAENCAMIISTTMENIGVMVAEVRIDLDNPGAFEWFQWLAEILESMQPDQPAPAYEAHKNWKPSGLTPEI
jgi:hypothetical protein